MKQSTRRITDNRGRLGEILEVLRKNEITKGMTPEKLCSILEELGPTFIKLGQILSMRSDFLPQEYCEALTRLRGSVNPMPYDQVVSIIESSYGEPLEHVFSSFEPQALGSASIAQVHAATLITGEEVVVKVQREGIHETMNRDIILLKRASGLLKYSPGLELVDFNKVLDEMWIVAQQEMNFLTEAQNLETFRVLNADVSFVDCPALERMHTTSTVLVMENVRGISIDDKEALTAAGYDLAEIGEKLADNYVKQIIEDGFFHADPHPGNIRIREGKIIYLDMGMMGTLTERERKILSSAVEGVARGDAEACMDAVLKLGKVDGEVDRRRLFQDCEGMLDNYASQDLGTMDLSAMVSDMANIMKTHHIGMPGGLTMLVRGLATIEGVVVDLAPEINVAQVATGRISRMFLQQMDLRSALTRNARTVYESATKALNIPALISDALHTGLKGETSLGIEHHPGEDLSQFAGILVYRICLTLLCMAFILGAALEKVDEPVLGGMSWFGCCCAAGAVICLGILAMPVLRKKQDHESNRKR